MAFNDYRPAWAVPELTPTQRLVLLYLAECRHGKDGPDYNLCCPGYRNMMKVTGLAKGTISKTIQQLAEKGMVTIEKDPHCRRSNRYFFSWNSSSSEPQGSPDEPRVQGANPGFAEKTQGSPGEPRVRPVDRNKEANQEEKKEAKREAQQQPPQAAVAAAVAASLYGQKQNQEIEIGVSGVSSLAQAFSGYLERPLKPRAAGQLEGLLSREPDLPELIEYIYEHEPKGKWKGLLAQAHNPVKYLASVLEPVRASYERWREIMEKRPARFKSAASGTDGTSIEDLEDEEGSSAEENLSADRTSLEEEGW